MPTTVSSDVVEGLAKVRGLTISVRSLPRREAADHFDKVMRAHGVERSTLSGDDVKKYDEWKANYVQVCVRLHESPRKRQVLQRRHEASVRWAERQAAFGKRLWGVSPPEAVYLAAGVPTPRPVAVARVARPREVAGSSRRSSDSGGTHGGDSGDPPRPVGAGNVGAAESV
jgi:hypothetical protein